MTVSLTYTDSRILLLQLLYRSIHSTAFGHLQGPGSHTHPLIIFLSVCVNARCSLLIQHKCLFLLETITDDRERAKERERERKMVRERGNER